MKAAFIGLSQSGKSTLLAAVSGKEPKPIGVVAVDEAVVPVPDEKLDWLTELYKPKKTICGTIDCVDLPGFNFADDSGRKTARKLINKIRTTDLLIFVVRAFEDDSVAPYKNRIDPIADLVELKTELLLADLELVTTRIERLEKQVHKPTKTQAQDKAELAVQMKLLEVLENEKPISSAIANDKELALVKSLGFLTMKPMMVAVNGGEGDIGKVFEFAEAVDETIPVITVCAKLDCELAQLDDESKCEFMADLGISESSINKFVASCYKALGYISFLTVGPDEVRAWPIQNGTTALLAAGKIHSDIQRGFIRAETIAYNDLKELGSEKAVKAAGKARLEGKEYVVKNGDIIDFRFNV